MVGNWRWWSAALPRGTIGDRYHHCVAGTPQPGSHANDGAALRAARRVKTRTYPELTAKLGGLDWWCWRPKSEGVGQRKLKVLAPAGQSESQSRTSSPPGSSSSCLVAQVAHYSGMLQRKVVRDVSVGIQRWTRKRRSHSHHDGGHG